MKFMKGKREHEPAGFTEDSLNKLSEDVNKLKTLPHSSDSTLRRLFTGPPKMNLPKIPSPEEWSQTSTDNENYYSTTKDTTTRGQIYSEKDMCLILNMKTGLIYNRWMGTITIARDINKCVMFSTVADAVRKKREIHWEAFVKRALELPRLSGIVNIEGIAVDQANLYLLNEHLVCKPLEARLQGPSYDSHDDAFAPMSVSEVITHARGILEAMEALHSYGFLHPGLSVRKVLMTNQGTCKLYDFCLTEDAVKLVTLKKSQITATLNDFALEALLRHEYSQASDVWAMAVLIWQILSIGCPPFECDEDIGLYSGGADMNPPSAWPIRYQQLQNPILFDCWKKDCSDRPTIKQLRTSFKAVFDSVMENSFYEIPTADTYTPMNVATDTS